MLKTEDYVEAIVMNLREILMEYFKGSCVDKLISTSIIKRVAVNPSNSGQYQYQREQARRAQEQRVYIRDVPIMNIQHSPDRVTFYTEILSRSKELRDIHRDVDKFLQEYLPAVEREENKDATISS